MARKLEEALGQPPNDLQLLQDHNILNGGKEIAQKKHVAVNIPYLTKEDLKGKNYLAVHLYPDDSVEITLTDSDSMPRATKKGLAWEKKLDDMK